jgi:hypothetical protein
MIARGIEAGWPRRPAARFTRARCGRCRTRLNGKATKTKFRESGPPRGIFVCASRFEPEALGNASSGHLPWRFLGRKFRLQSAMHFKRVTRSGQFADAYCTPNLELPPLRIPAWC